MSNPAWWGVQVNINNISLLGVRAGWLLLSWIVWSHETHSTGFAGLNSCLGARGTRRWIIAKVWSTFWNSYPWVSICMWLLTIKRLCVISQLSGKPVKSYQLYESGWCSRQVSVIKLNHHISGCHPPDYTYFVGWSSQLYAWGALIRGMLERPSIF